MDALLAETEHHHLAFRTFFDASPIAGLLVDADGRIVRANAAAHALLSHPAGGLAGRRLDDLLRTRPNAARREPRRIARRGDGTELAVSVVRAGATEGDLEVVLLDEGGDRRAETDGRTYVTERRARERALALARLSGAVAKASTAQDVGRILIEELSRATPSSVTALTVLDEPAAEYELVGVRTRGTGRMRPERWPSTLPTLTRDAVLSRRPLLVAHRDYAERYQEIVGFSDAPPDSVHLALPIVAGARAIGVLNLRFDDDPHLDQTAIAHLQTLVDAGAQALVRAQLEDAERATRRLLSAVIDQMPLGVLIVEAGSFRLLHANDTYLELFGPWTAPVEVDPEAGRLRTRQFRLDGTALPVGERPIVRAVAGERVSDESVRLELVDGTVRTVSASAGPVRDERGTVIAGVAVYADVTSRREAEAARDAFIGILSHELRTPITSIYAGATLIERRARDAGVAELARDVADESERLHRLVEDLLVLSRVERGLDIARNDPVLLHHLVTRVVEFEARRWTEARFEVDLPPSIPIVAGDEGYVEQIVRNLLSNAVKYGPRGGHVRVVGAVAGDEVVVRVLDDGPGFRPGDEEAVFDLFFRAPSAAERAPGAGIGLYAVRALAAAMGGRAWARRREEGGAEVGFALRRLDGDD